MIHPFIKNLLLLAGLSVALAQSLQAQTLTAEVKADAETYRQYMAGQWDSLLVSGKQAIEQGFDNYYFRARLGRAYFEKEQYAKACQHFEKALAFAPTDVFAMSYLYYSQLYFGRINQSRYLANKLHTLSGEAFYKQPLLKSMYLEGGPSFLTGKSEANQTDLDGSENVYGESDVTGNGYYAHTGLQFNLAPRLGLYVGYSNLGLYKHHRAMSADTTLYQRRYSVKENDYFISLPFYLGKNLSLTPAFRHTHFRTDPVQISYDFALFQYKFDTLDFSFNDYVYALDTRFEYRCFALSLAGALINQNGNSYGQLTLSGTLYPFGNLNLYATTSLLQQVGTNSKKQFVFNQILGFRPVKKIWIETDLAVGTLRDMVFANGFVMYNTGDDIDLRIGVNAVMPISKHLVVSLRYQYFNYTDSYYTFENNVINVDKKLVFNKQIIIGGLTWLF